MNTNVFIVRKFWSRVVVAEYLCSIVDYSTTYVADPSGRCPPLITSVGSNPLAVYGIHDNVQAGLVVWNSTSWSNPYTGPTCTPPLLPQNASWLITNFPTSKVASILTRVKRHTNGISTGTPLDSWLETHWTQVPRGGPKALTTPLATGVRDSHLVRPKSHSLVAWLWLM